MRLPFTIEQFFDVFARYNAAIWPTQMVLTSVGIAVAVMGIWGFRRFAIGGLAALWVWMAVAYHIVFFAGINPAAYLFVAIFLLEAVLLAAWAMRPEAGVEASRVELITGFILIVWAVVGYPLTAFLAGQRYPAVPTFGVPCPTTIFTFGVFCLFASEIPLRALVIPMSWTVVALFATSHLGVPEDFALAVAALVTVMLLAVVRHGGQNRREVWS
jgi:hypothetical protein